jgi:hypothetical protein
VYEYGTEGAWYDYPRKAQPDDPAAAHVRIFPHVRAVEEDQEDIRLLNSLNAKLYSNREAMAFDWNNQFISSFRPLNNNLENGIQSVVDTLVSKIGTSRPKATIISRGAGFDTYLKARQLDRFMWGEFVHHKLHKKMERVFKDACVYGNGFLKIDMDGDEVYCERVHPSEIIVDQRECISDDIPLQMHQRKLVSRLWLLKTYGKNKKLARLIKAADHEDGRYSKYRSRGEPQILVIESWKLATRKGAGDGRHTICINNATLVDEVYDRDRFPFVWEKWAEPESGFYGRSLVSDLTGYQIRLNDLNEVIQLAQDLMCVPRLLVEQGSGVQATQLDNMVAKVLKYRGVKPEAVTWTAFNSEIYNERDRIRQSMFHFAGITELSAQGKLPTQARLDSSDALREATAIEDARFNDKTQAHESAYKEAASHLLELNARKYKTLKKTTKRTFRLGNLVRQIDWKSIGMEEDEYVLEISASSIINQSPAARKDTLNNWFAQGVITADQYKAWSGSPDLERISDLMSASEDYVEYHIQEMLNNRPMTPDPNMNLQYGFGVVQDTYQHIRTLDCPENVVMLFVNWMDTAGSLMNPPAPPMQAAPMPMGPEAMPPGPPMGPEMGAPVGPMGMQ